jgi:hypothetical protein
VRVTPRDESIPSSPPTFKQARREQPLGSYRLGDLAGLSEGWFLVAFQRDQLIATHEQHQRPGVVEEREELTVGRDLLACNELACLSPDRHPPTLGHLGDRSARE